MKKIGNFFYDNNDILLAIAIIILAAGLIIWRLGVILDYPETIAQSTAGTIEIESAENSTSVTDDE